MRESLDVVNLGVDEEGAVEPDARDRGNELCIGSSLELLQQLCVETIDLSLDSLEAVQA